MSDNRGETGLIELLHSAVKHLGDRFEHLVAVYAEDRKVTEAQATSMDIVEDYETAYAELSFWNRSARRRSKWGAGLWLEPGHFEVDGGHWRRGSGVQLSVTICFRTSARSGCDFDVHRDEAHTLVQALGATFPADLGAINSPVEFPGQQSRPNDGLPRIGVHASHPAAPESASYVDDATVLWIDVAEPVADNLREVDDVRIEGACLRLKERLLLLEKAAGLVAGFYAGVPSLTRSSLTGFCGEYAYWKRHWNDVEWVGFEGSSFDFTSRGGAAVFEVKSCVGHDEPTAPTFSKSEIARACGDENYWVVLVAVPTDLFRELMMKLKPIEKRGLPETRPERREVWAEALARSTGVHVENLPRADLDEVEKHLSRIAEASSVTTIENPFLRDSLRPLAEALRTAAIASAAVSIQAR